VQRIGKAFVTAALALGLMAPAAHAAFGVQSFNADVFADNTDTTVQTQAGSTPYDGVTDFVFNTTPVLGTPDDNVQTIRVDLPPGLISNPEATPKCSDTDFGNQACPANTWIGTENLTVGSTVTPIPISANVYNLNPQAGQVSRFGFNTTLGPTYIIGGVRDTPQNGLPGDFGLFFTISDIPQAANIVESKLTFFGNPAARNAGGGTPAPFIRLPTFCAGPQTTTLTVTSWMGASDRRTDTTDTGATGCDQVPFAPTIAMTPSTTQRDAPVGATIDVGVPWESDPTKLASSHVKDTVVTLPPGMTISPSAANGLQACTDDQFGQGTHNAITCPDASKVGTAEIKTPVLSDSLKGNVYLAQPTPDHPYRLFVDADGFGLSVRLTGIVTPDPNTGQLTTTFADTPQVPFSDFILTLNPGPNATLASPLDCGNATTTSSITPYSGTAAATPSTSYPVDLDGNGGACPPTPFNLGFSAGTQSLAAGAFTPFSLTVTRDDGQQFLSGLTVRQPAGLLGIIQNVPLCDDANAAAGTCPDASRVGTSTVASGPGSAPFSLSGPVYLAGPYGGGPFSLVIAIRALAGPFDLGTVVVRAPIKVDPTDSHLVIETKSLPTILQGIPLRLRSVNVTIDRANFLFNPTSCDQLAVGATLTSSTGATQDVSSPFQATGCDALPYAPTMTATTTPTKKGSAAGLSVSLNQGAGEANTKSVSVHLPPGLAANFTTLQKACPQATFQADPKTCPAGSHVGTVTAATPVLAQPLTGVVYLEAHEAGKLPSLEAVLEGSGITVDLSGTIALGSGITSTFATVPDVPITSFRIDLPPSPNPALAAGADLCATPLPFTAAILGQNGKQVTVNSALGVAGCGLQITSAKVKGNTATLKLHTPGPGTVTVTGKGLTKVRKTFGPAGSYTVKAKLSKAGKKALKKARARKKKRTRKLTIKLKAAYAPTNGAVAGGQPIKASSASRKLTFK
jgi:hypothetical protein